MTSLAVRVATRYRQAQEEAVWLPDLLGGKEARLVEELLKAIKRLPAHPMGGKNTKGLAGGLCYLLLKEVGAGQAAEKLWDLLDRDAGLSPGQDVQQIVWRVAPHLAGPDRKLHAAAIGVALLQRTRQPNKAQKANHILSHVFAREVAEAAPPEAPGETETPTRAFAKMVDGLSEKAQLVATKIKKDPATAARLVWEVLTNVNAHGASRTAEGILSPLVPAPGHGDVDPQEIGSYVSQISSVLDYGVVEAGAFGVALMQAVGQTSYASKLNRAMVQEFGKYLGVGTMF
jgi:hypothetical protein